MAQVNLGKVVGDSAYEIAVKNGFVGSEEEWLASLVANVEVKEAPNDGKQYARQNKAWTQVVGQVEEAPSDGKVYGRNGQTKSWAEVQIESIPDETINALFP